VVEVSEPEAVATESEVPAQVETTEESAVTEAPVAEAMEAPAAEATPEAATE
jgi:hypothetical protein